MQVHKNLFNYSNLDKCNLLLSISANKHEALSVEEFVHWWVWLQSIIHPGYGPSSTPLCSHDPILGPAPTTCDSHSGYLCIRPLEVHTVHQSLPEEDQISNCSPLWQLEINAPSLHWCVWKFTSTWGLNLTMHSALKHLCCVVNMRSTRKMSGWINWNFHFVRFVYSHLSDNEDPQKLGTTICTPHRCSL